MDPLDQVVAGMTGEVCARLRRALETGRWPDGRQLTAAQTEHCMQLVIAWEGRNLPADQRTGYVGDVCRSRSPDAGAESLIASDSGADPQ